jgi:hypothetical protein
VTLSNLQQEEVWIEGMNRLDDCMEVNPGAYLLTEQYDELSKEQAETWIMEAAYESNITTFKTEWYKGVKSIVLSKKSA